MHADHGYSCAFPLTDFYAHRHADFTVNVSSSSSSYSSPFSSSSSSSYCFATAAAAQPLDVVQAYDCTDDLGADAGALSEPDDGRSNRDASSTDCFRRRLARPVPYPPYHGHPPSAFIP